MSMTNIEWTDKSWNPITGCTPVSEGCAHCWAKRQAMRRMAPEWKGDRPWTEVRCHPERLEIPLHWRQPSKIATCLMGDLFHPDVPFDFVDRVFATMALAPQHTFQVLTKRPERMREYLTAFAVSVRVRDLARQMVLNGACGVMAARSVDTEFSPTAQVWHWPLQNVWVGASIEDQPSADERIPILLQTPAAVRFASYEPALGPVDFTRVAVPDDQAGKYAGHGFTFNALQREDDLTLFNSPNHLDWVIVGGENGPRPCELAWIRSAVRQCGAAGRACFVKQAGAYVVDRNDRLSTEGPGCDPSDPRDWPEPEGGWDDGPRGNIERDLSGSRDDYQGAPIRIRLRARKGNDMAEWPEDVRVREFPRWQ